FFHRCAADAVDLIRVAEASEDAAQPKREAPRVRVRGGRGGYRRLGPGLACRLVRWRGLSRQLVVAFISGQPFALVCDLLLRLGSIVWSGFLAQVALEGADGGIAAAKLGQRKPHVVSQNGRGLEPIRLLELFEGLFEAAFGVELPTPIVMLSGGGKRG